MEISKSTPYVRYRENISSTLHKGTIHIESEYLDRERKTTIESIEGQTWQNMVNGENKEEDILPRLGLKIEGNEDVLDTVEQHMPIDTIIGDVEPVANEDGTYTYEISTMEGSYAKTLDGENNFSLTSDGLVGDMYIKYNAQGEEVTGNIVMNGQSSYTIENSNTGEIKSAILSGSTKYRDIDTGEFLETFEEGRNLELVSVKMPVLTTVGRNLVDEKNFTKGYITSTGGIDTGSATNSLTDYIRVKPNTSYAYKAFVNGSTAIYGECAYYNKNKNFISRNTKGHSNNECIITPSDCYYIRFWNPLYVENGNVHPKCMIVETTQLPSTLSKYEPYKSNILTVNEDVTLRSNGDICDELNLLTGQLTQRIGEDGVVLSQEVIKTVDLTIKDQDNKIIQTLHTYPSTTHINLSSDGLIPNAELSYTMYGNIGETTGEQITDGTDSKLIEGKVYGDTLLNVLPSPSLKNSMENNSMQKLNNGYDNINVVDGEFKKAILYGQTLVNLVTQKSGSFNGTRFLRNPLTQTLKANTKYFVKFNLKDSSLTNGVTCRLRVGTDGAVVGGLNSTGIITVIGDGYNYIEFYIENADDVTNGLDAVVDDIMVIEYQDGMENWDVPYFEGMQSVKMPSLMTSDKRFTILPYEVFENSTPINYQAYTRIDFGLTLTNVTCSIKLNNDMRLKMLIDGFEEVATDSGILKCVEYSKKLNSVSYIGFYNWGDIKFGNGKEIILSMLKNGELEIIFSKDGENMYPHYSSQTKSNTLTLNEDIALRAVGNVRDELDCVTGELTERIGEVVLDGSENWSAQSKDDVSTAYVCTDFRDLFANYVSSSFMFSNIPYSPNSYEIGTSEGWFIDANKRIWIRKLNSAIGGSTSDDFKTWLSQNPITVIYVASTNTTKTVDLSITNQDNQPQTSLHSIPNGYISTSSQGLLPKVSYEAQTSNSYYLDMVKPNTQYTTKSSSDCNATIDGTSYPLSANGTFTTPSTITDNLMVLDAPVNDLMFIEGDLTGRELDYFTGLQSVDMPVLTIYGDNLWDGKWYEGFSNDGGGGKPAELNSLKSAYRTDYIKIPKNSSKIYVHRFCDASNFTSPSIYAGFFDKDKQRLSLDGDATPANFSIPTNAEYVVIHVWNSVNYDFTTLRININTTPVNETSYEPHQSSILTTTPQIALHRIGDVKDELDLVNECVVRRVGKVVLDGSENWSRVNNSDGTGRYYYKFNEMRANSDIISPSLPTVSFSSYGYGSKYCVCSYLNNDRYIFIYTNHGDVNSFKQWLSENNVELYYQSQAPTTELVRIVPQNRKQSTVSLTLQSPLQKVGNVADQLRWNPYKGHYVRYNYIQDGVANSTYTFEDLKDMNERKFVNLYNQRTYIDTDHTVQVISHGLSRYCLAEQGKQYQVRWDWVEKPSVDTIKVDLCGNVKEIPSSDNSVVIDVEKFTHQFIQIQGLGLTGKITNLMVIETIDGEIPDVDFFSGIQCVGNTVTIDGTPKVQIDMEQTNGNLLDIEPVIFNNGNYISYCWNENNRGMPIRNGKTYTFKHLKRQDGEWGDYGLRTFDENLKLIRMISLISGAKIREHGFTAQYNEKYIRGFGQMTSDGSTHTYYPLELCYTDMVKDSIRPRYYDKESIILPMKLCRVGNIYDNLYYDDLKGYYRIQQSIGHKYFTGETTEVWTMETTNGYRTIKFTCTSANIDQIALGQTICNSFKHLSTINDDIEGFIIYNGNFVIRVDKDRLTDKTVDGFKTLLASSPIHLFYQLKTPQMINLTEYPNRIELNTYRDEIFTFFKGMNPTKFTLSVPMDKTYRYEIEEEGQGLANRVAVNNETISAENVVAVKEIRGQGIANIIEDVNNVVITPRPNHGGIATSHTLNNTKPAIIRIHGFESSGDTAIGTYNTTDKAYQLKVMSSNGDNSLSDYYVLNVPYKLETYADGTKDMVYYDEAYKQWHFKGLSVKEYTIDSDGTLGEVVEVFKGLTPRSGMIAEFKLMFTSGTTSSRMYYSLNGTTYNYTSLRNMSDGNYLYVGIFNTGGTKIDIAYKTDPNAEYTNLSPLSTQVPECFMVNQIQSCTFCEVTINKQYIYSEMNSPIELDTYDGTTKVFMDGNATDTNIIIRNECTTKIVNTYTDTEYTVYWKYVDGLGNLRITLGGTTVEVDGKQEYATIKTQLNAPQELLYVGGYNLSIKDLMVIKGAKIDDLPYFEGSRQVGTLVLDEEGNKSYKITLVQGGSVLEQRDENTITFKDDNKHNVVVHKIVGVCPTKVD